MKKITKLTYCVLYLFIFDPVNIARFVFHVMIFLFLTAWSSDAFDISLCCGHLYGR